MEKAVQNYAKACELNNEDTRSFFLLGTTHMSLNKFSNAIESFSVVVTQTPDDVIRLSVGLEHIDDIIYDLNQALDKSSKADLKAVS